MPIHLHEPYQIFFATLSHKSRWEIIHLLKHGPLPATQIAKRLNLEQSLISHHLGRLERCGFLKVIVYGRQHIYSLNHRAIQPLLKLMDKHIETFCKKRCCS